MNLLILLKRSGFFWFFWICFCHGLDVFCFFWFFGAKLGFNGYFYWHIVWSEYHCNM
jgi:hypothetical protein